MCLCLIWLIWQFVQINTALESAPNHGGSVTSKATIDNTYGGYIGYVADPDGHLWELVYPPERG